MYPLIAAKLFVSILAVSDTGAVSQSTGITDFPTMAQCQKLKGEMNYTTSVVENGHKITIRVKADCAPIQSPLASDIPPPVAGMINGFINGLR